MARSQYKSYSGIALLASNLRKNQTSSEKILWEVLRRKNLFGYKFLRQHLIFYREDNNWIEFFIADFYCSRLNLIIELDGECHKDRIDYDYDRDSKLLNKGILVVRIKNNELADMDNTILFLDGVIRNRIKQITENKLNNPPSLIV